MTLFLFMSALEQWVYYSRGSSWWSNGLTISLTGGSVTALHWRTYYWSHTLRFLLLTNILTHFKKTLYIYLFIYLYIFSANSEQQFNFSNMSIFHCKLNTPSIWKYNLNHSIHLLFILVFILSTESNLEHLKILRNIERILLWVKT